MSPHLPLTLLLSLLTAPCAMAADTTTPQGASATQPADAGSARGGAEKPGKKENNDEEDAEPDCD